MDTIGKSNVDDEIVDDTTPLDQVTCKETLIASRTLHNFMVHYEKTTLDIFDTIKKFRDEFQLDLNVKKKTHSRIIFHYIVLYICVILKNY